MISVVIPYYNKSKDIKVTLTSLQEIYNNDTLDSEIIIVNDGSRKEEALFLKRLVDSLQCDKIKIIDLEKNQGVSNARNVGFVRTKGEYVYFLDADDFLLSNISDFISSSIRSESTSLFNLRINRRVFPHYQFGLSNVDEVKLSELFSTRSLHLSNIVFRRCDIENIRFRKDLKYGEDLYFIFQAIINRRINFIDEVISVYNYDGKFHPAEDSAFPAMLKDFKEYNTLYELLYKSYNERIYLHNRFYSQSLPCDNLVVSKKIKIISCLKSPLVYRLLQLFRTGI